MSFSATDSLLSAVTTRRSVVHHRPPHRGHPPHRCRHPPHRRCHDDGAQVRRPSQSTATGPSGPGHAAVGELKYRDRYLIRFNHYHDDRSNHPYHCHDHHECITLQLCECHHHWNLQQQ